MLQPGRGIREVEAGPYPSLSPATSGSRATVVSPLPEERVSLIRIHQERVARVERSGSRRPIYTTPAESLPREEIPLVWEESVAVAGSPSLRPEPSSRETSMPPQAGPFTQQPRSIVPPTWWGTGSSTRTLPYRWRRTRAATTCTPPSSDLRRGSPASGMGPSISTVTTTAPSFPMIPSWLLMPIPFPSGSTRSVTTRAGPEFSVAVTPEPGTRGITPSFSETRVTLIRLSFITASRKEATGAMVHPTTLSRDGTSGITSFAQTVELVRLPAPSSTGPFSKVT